MDSYIVYLDDLSEGVRELASHSRLTHILPFLSSAVVEDGGFMHAGSAHVVSAVKVAKVSVVMEKVRSAVKYHPYEADPYRGCGANVAVIDTGLAPHLDFLLPNRVRAFADVVNGRTEPYDDNGHGTAVCGALAGSGLMSGGKYAGIASGAGIIPVKAIGADGEGSTADILQAMQWVWTNKEKHNIGVVCMSFGADPLPGNDPLAAGVAALHAKGITVVVSGGNDGPKYGTIKSPGISPFALTVGGACEGDGEFSVSVFSSRGSAGGIRKPDVVAPAEDVVCAARDADYVAVTGTSIATPIVAGACAVLLARHPTYTPDKVKELIMKNASPVAGGDGAGGSGLLDLSFLAEP